MTGSAEAVGRDRVALPLDPCSDAALGVDEVRSPLGVLEGTAALLDMDRIDVGTPLADVETAGLTP